MNKFLLIALAALLFGGCTPKDLFVKPPAGLDIVTTPPSTVYLNGVSVGDTPYTNKSTKPGEYTLRLVPLGDTTLTPYETALTLASRASVYVSHAFSTSPLDSATYIMRQEAEPSGSTYLSIISDPDTTNVTLDDKPRGFTPLSKLTISPGEHHLTVASPGYISQELAVNAVKGFNTIISFSLANQTITLAPPPTATASALPSPSATSSALPSSTPPAISIAKPYVEVKETETGWLRVRQEGSGTSTELGKVNTGEKLKYLGETTELGWYKVEFEGSPGYVSGKYATLVK